MLALRQGPHGVSGDELVKVGSFLRAHRDVLAENARLTAQRDELMNTGLGLMEQVRALRLELDGALRRERQMQRNYLGACAEAEKRQAEIGRLERVIRDQDAVFGLGEAG